jgi:gamma-glutamylcyclotransferase
MSTFTYFAYGSNMLDERLSHLTRCPSARVLGTGSAAGWRLAFIKRGADGSGKATMLRSSRASDRVHGVLFTIDLTERVALDRVEGPDYERLDDLAVARVGDEGLSVSVEASVYVARPGAIDPTLVAFDWYRALVIAGARRHGLPADVLAEIESVPARPDPNPGREQRLLALEQLAAAGCTRLVDGA